MSNFNFIGNFLGKVAKPSKDGHDMSAQFAYSLPFGTISVVDYIDVVPGEHYKCNYSGYVQTAPMREDNFAQIHNNMKAVFVPRSSMLRNYLDKMKHSGDKTTRKNLQFDYRSYEFSFPLYNALCFLWPSYFLSRIFEDLSALVDDVYNIYWIKQYQELDHTTGFYYKINNEWVDVEARTGTPETYKNVLLEILRSLFSPMPAEPVLSLGEIFDDWFSYCRSRSGNLYCHDGLRLLDAFDYGNYAPIFDSIYKQQLLNHRLSDFFDLLPESVMKCGYQPAWTDIPVPGYNTDSSFKVLNSLHLYEYQFYISSCERSNYRSPSVNVITYDTLASHVGSATTAYYNFRVNDNLCQRCWTFGPGGLSDSWHNNFGYFTLYDPYDDGDNIGYSNSLSESENLANLIALKRPQAEFRYLFSLANPLLQPDMFTTMQNSVVSGSVPYISSGTNVSIQGLNELSAAYKLQQDLLRSGVRRDMQMKALFGVGVDELTNDIYVLDQSSSNINIQGLLNQAETEVAELGERGARGNGSSGLDFEFDSKDYGTIIVVQWFSTEMFYESFMIHKLNRQLWSEDWLEQFNNLGLEAVKNLDCTIYSKPYFVNSSYNEVDQEINLSQTLGFSARFFERKQRVNKARGLFSNYGFTLDPALGDNKSPNPWRRNYALSRGNGAFGGYVPTVIDQQVDKFSKMSDLYYNPFMVNNIFSVVNDGAAHGSLAYDQFRCFLNCIVHKVSPMPKLGLFRLI